jgi:hypothetical protein
VRVKPQTGGDVVQLRPLQGFGKGPSEFEVIVRNGVTDLSGNNIIRQLQFTFKTIFNANADQAGFIEETFLTNNKQDTNFGPGINSTGLPVGDDVLATWNAQGSAGFLAGVVTDTPFVAASTGTSISAVNLFGVAPIRFQNYYTVTDMGARPRTITSFSWRQGQTTLAGLTYPNCTAQMGHANDIVAAAGFPGNATTSPGPSTSYFRDTPVVVFQPVTYTANQLVGNYVTAPKFSKNFPFDGSNPVILDISHGGNGTANDRWQGDIAYPLQTCIYANFSSTPASLGSRTWYFDTKFTYLTPGAEAQSLFYDNGRDDARILPQQIVPSTQPQGTTVTFIWQGAKSDTQNPSIPDLTTLTPWLADVRQLATYRYIRFRVQLLNNLTTKIAPSVDTLTVPFTYK